MKRRRFILGGVRSVTEFMAIFVLMCFGAITAAGQTSVQELHKVLRDQAAFTAADFSAIERGEIVVKVLAVKDNREVAVCGLVRTQAPLEVGLRAFQMSMTQQSQNSILESGKFSSPPTLEDLQPLTLENRDIEDLKRCVAGDCKLKMSAAMIERFRKDVNWSAPDYRLQTTRLFRQLLLDYVRDYLVRGDSALMEYHDRSRAVRLDEEQRSLLEASLYLNDFAPEFTRYLEGFPSLELTGVENSFHWTKIKFGLKPVTIFTHVATYRRRHTGGPQVVSVSKQIYANHYFDSSLALTAFIDIPKNGVASDSYLLYTNRSRADALSGAFSKLKRNLVEDEAVDSLEFLLLQTKQNLEVASINQVGPPPESAKQRIVGWLFGGMRVFALVVTILLLVGLFLLIKRNSKRAAVSFERNQ